MANTKSAQKALRVTERRTASNIRMKDKYKEAKKDVMDSVKSNKMAEAKKGLPKAFKAIDKAVKNKVIHRNKAARMKSELSKALEKDNSSK
jgi:small subunit ribosomal protein S20